MSSIPFEEASVVAYECSVLSLFLLTLAWSLRMAAPNLGTMAVEAVASVPVGGRR